ncbi:hypothetical protein GYMLUDRAFT_63622 [Collybiopsis luxurians FD-317 M1]|uniref:Uncharacterized protein n=1 Tax=Collybiopsis luxurians FD-317 M1 TaxID=944289 RepID=A0A0D0AT84_9AGAR|nr:hypothetical protein GYMLUDRAFT_63622 [Collybiopsis luxurians FD-317 M1]
MSPSKSSRLNKCKAPPSDEKYNKIESSGEDKMDDKSTTEAPQPHITQSSAPTSLSTLLPSSKKQRKSKAGDNATISSLTKKMCSKSKQNEQELAHMFRMDQPHWPMDKVVSPDWGNHRASLQIIFCNSFSSSKSPEDIETGGDLAWNKLIHHHLAPCTHLHQFICWSNMPPVQAKEMVNLHIGQADALAENKTNVDRLQELGLDGSPTVAENCKLVDRALTFHQPSCMGANSSDPIPSSSRAVPLSGKDLHSHGVPDLFSHVEDPMFDFFPAGVFPMVTGSSAPHCAVCSLGVGSLPSAPIFGVPSFPLGFCPNQETSEVHKGSKKMSNMAVQTASPPLPLSSPTHSKPAVTLPRDLPSNVGAVQCMYADLFDSFQHIQGEHWASDTVVKDMHVQFEMLHAENQCVVAACVLAEWDRDELQVQLHCALSSNAEQAALINSQGKELSHKRGKLEGLGSLHPALKAFQDHFQDWDAVEAFKNEHQHHGLLCRDYDQLNSELHKLQDCLLCQETEVGHCGQLLDKTALKLHGVIQEQDQFQTCVKMFDTTAKVLQDSRSASHQHSQLLNQLLDLQSKYDIVKNELCIVSDLVCNLSCLDIPEFLSSLALYLSNDLYTALNWMHEIPDSDNDNIAALCSFIDNLVQKFQELFLQSSHVTFEIMHSMQRGCKGAWVFPLIPFTELTLPKLIRHLPFHPPLPKLKENGHMLHCIPFSLSLKLLISLLSLLTCIILFAICSLSSLCPKFSTQTLPWECFSGIATIPLPLGFVEVSPESPSVCSSSPNTQYLLSQEWQDFIGPQTRDVFLILNDPGAESIYEVREPELDDIDIEGTEGNTLIGAGEAMEGVEGPAAIVGSVAGGGVMDVISEQQDVCAPDGQIIQNPLFLPLPSGEVFPETPLITPQQASAFLPGRNDGNEVHLGCEEDMRTEYLYNSIFDASSTNPSLCPSPELFGEFLSDGEDIYWLVATNPVTYELVLQEEMQSPLLTFLLDVCSCLFLDPYYISLLGCTVALSDAFLLVTYLYL